VCVGAIVLYTFRPLLTLPLPCSVREGRQERWDDVTIVSEGFLATWGLFIASRVNRERTLIYSGTAASPVPRELLLRGVRR